MRVIFWPGPGAEVAWPGPDAEKRCDSVIAALACASHSGAPFAAAGAARRRIETMETKNNGMKSVYTVVERNGKSFWLKLGIGFVNKDGSINLKLDATPTNGTLQIREYESPSERRGDALGAARASLADEAALS
jgi:hypothetical protein